MTDKTNELKCCPFCGGATIHRGTNALHPNNQHYRECCGCFTRIEGYASSEAADMAWNRRYAHADHTAAIREKALALLAKLEQWDSEYEGIVSPLFVKERTALKAALEGNDEDTDA